jgi:hypothetical protein
MFLIVGSVSLFFSGAQPCKTTPVVGRRLQKQVMAERVVGRRWQKQLMLADG